MRQTNKAARDLWAQIFERAAAKPDAALYRFDKEEEATQKDLAAQALRKAGWSEAEIKQCNASKIFHVDLKSSSSPGVAPTLELNLKFLADRVRKEISKTGETSQEKIEIGIDPTSGVSATLTNVIMTDEGILSVSAFLFRWCGLIARAYTRTLRADVAHWTSPILSPEGDKAVLLKSPELAFYWCRIFMSFSSTGTHILVPYRPSTPAEFTLFEQVAWAMEFFTVAHEFGHHVLGHRRVDDDPKLQEFQADAFAAKICDGLEFEPFPSLSNPYMRTSAGGSLMLLALEILRSFEVQQLGYSVAGETHPPASERIKRIAMRNLIQPKQLEMDQEFNRTVERIMGAVAAVMSDFYDAAGKEYIAEMRRKLGEVF